MKHLLFTIILLIGFNSVANAECAWVLWDKWEVTSIKDGKHKHEQIWTLIGATPRYEQCLENQKGVFGSYEKKANEEKIKYDTVLKIETVPFELVITSYQGGGSSIHSFYCLPDTIDPRK